MKCKRAYRKVSISTQGFRFFKSAKKRCKRAKPEPTGRKGTTSGLTESVTYDIFTVEDASVASMQESDTRSTPRGRVFCGLPMDLGSGCAAHLNALFWPTSDRRNIYLAEDRAGNLQRYCEQNEQKLRHAAQALTLLIQFQTAQARRIPLSSFPQYQQTSVGDFVADCFYKEFAQAVPQMHCTLSGEILQDWSFVAATTAQLECLGAVEPVVAGGKRASKDLAACLRAIGAPVVLLNEDILLHYERLPGVSGIWQKLQPASLRNCLRQNGKIASEQVHALFRYAVLDGETAELAGCRLCPTLAGSVVSFTGALTGYATDIEKRLLDHFPSTTVAAFTLELSQKLLATGLLQPLDTKVVHDLLCEHQDKHTVPVFGSLFAWLDAEKPAPGAEWRALLVTIARHIASQQDCATAIALVAYLDTAGDCPHLRAALQDIAWIPTEARPPDVWCGPWATTKRLVSVAERPAAWDYCGYAGMVVPILDRQLPIRGVDHAGVTFPSTVTIVGQLSAMVEAQAKKGKSSFFTDTVQKIYERLTVGDIQQFPTAWVWVGEQFVPGDHVSKARAASGLCPYHYYLREEWHALDVFGCIQEDLDSVALNAILHRICAEQRSSKRSAQVDAAIRVIDMLYDRREHDPVHGESLLVNGKGMLLPAKSILINDMTWESQARVRKDYQHELAHERISVGAGVYLGASGLKKATLAKACLMGNWLEATGQHEPLTNRLKNLLKDYPLESTVKEMLQNAEDAGATEFTVVCDWRSHASKSLLTPEMATLQGPALYFYNDAMFTDHDWNSIVKLGQGGKREAEDKIGRHGLGFNSIFNLTDVPSIWSGTRLFFSDPHVKYLEQVGAQHSRPGVRLDLARHDVRRDFPDQFACYQSLGYAWQDACFPGTLIRAPLRSAHHQSEISSIALDRKQWKELVKNLRNDAHLYVLFLKHVGRLQVVEISAGGVRTVVLSRECKKTDTMRTITDPLTNHHWNYDLQEYEKVQVACLRDSGEDGRFFCRLPLPVGTSCALHVSALFWPTQDRRSLVVGENLGGAIDAWSRANDQLLAHAAEASALLIERRTAAETRIATELFPITCSTTPCASRFAEIFYGACALRHPRMHCVVWGAKCLDDWNFLAVAGTEIDAKSRKQKGGLDASLQRALKDLNAPVIRLTDGIMQNYRKYNVSGGWDEFCPATMRAWLRTHQVPCQHVDAVLSYCMGDANVADLDGIALCRTSAGSVVPFSSTAPLVGCETATQAHLLHHFQSHGVAAFAYDDVITRKLLDGALLKKVDSGVVRDLLSHQDPELCVVRDFYKWVQDAAPRDLYVFDDLCILPAQDASASHLVPFRMRATAVPGNWRRLTSILRSCGVVVIDAMAEGVLEERGVDDLVEALSRALESHTRVSPGECQRELWRLLLDHLILVASESVVTKGIISSFVQKLPLFCTWPGDEEPALSYLEEHQYVVNLRKMTTSLRDALRTIPLPVFGEEDARKVGFMVDVGRRTEIWTAAEIILTHKLVELKHVEVMKIVLVEKLLTIAQLKDLAFVPASSGLFHARTLFWLPPDYAKLMSFSELERTLLESSWAQGERVVSCLRRIGLRSTLQDDEIIYVAQGIAEHGDREAAPILSHYLAKFRFTKRSLAAEDLCVQLREIAWLPSECRSDDWFGPWKADEIPFLRVSSAWCPWESRELAGCVVPVVSKDIEPAVLQRLNPTGLSDDVVVAHLRALVQAWHADESKSPKGARKKRRQAGLTRDAFLSVATEKIYEYLSSDVGMTEEWVWINDYNCFVSAKVVCKEPEAASFSPYVYALPPAWYDLKSFANIRVDLDAVVLLEVLTRIREAQQGHVPEPQTQETAKKRMRDPSNSLESMLDVSIRVIDSLYKRKAVQSRSIQEDWSVEFGHSDNEHLCRPLLPNTEGYLKPAEEIVINDMPWEDGVAIRAEYSGKLAHDRISPAVALYLGGQGLRKTKLEYTVRLESPLKDARPWLEVKGQHEPLSNRLKNLLKDYPLESVIKEMLQNAEDARATEFAVVVDWRTHGSKSLFTDGLKQWQGPAVYFYNDALFSERDWQAIVKLGEGGKRDLANQIGRHGLGFNSVFNLTDVPSIWSGNQVLFLDPHVRYLEELGARSDKPGIQVNLAVRDIRSNFPDQFAPYENIGFPFSSPGSGSHFPGTLIRVPLRTHPSEISNFVFGRPQWAELLEKLESESHLYLLFLRSVRSLSVYEIDANGPRQCVLGRARDLQGDAEGSDPYMIVQVTNRDHQRVWEYDAQQHQDVCVAALRRHVVNAETLAVEELGRFFCGLPLSIGSSCAFHISALFWPTQDRRSIPVQESLGGTMQEWSRENERMLRHGAEAVALLIERRTAQNADGSRRIPLQLFPMTEKQGNSTPCAIFLAQVFFAEVALRHPRMHCTLWGGRVLEDWSFLVVTVPGSAPRDEDACVELLPVFRAIECPVVGLDASLLTNYKQLVDSRAWAELTPATLRAWLRSTKTEVPFEHLDALSFLEYCVSDDKLVDLDGCHICPTTARTVRPFSKDSPLVASQTLVEQKLLGHFHSNEVAAVPLGLACKFIQCGLLRPLNTVFVQTLLGGDEVARRSSLKDFYRWVKNERPCDLNLLNDIELVPICGSDALVPWKSIPHCVPSRWLESSPVLTDMCGVYVVKKFVESAIFCEETSVDAVVSALAHSPEMLKKERVAVQDAASVLPPKAVKRKEVNSVRALSRKLLTHLAQCVADEPDVHTALVSDFIKYLPLFCSWPPREENIKPAGGKKPKAPALRAMVEDETLHYLDEYRYCLCADQITPKLRAILARGDIVSALAVFHENSEAIRELMTACGGIIQLRTIREMVIEHALLSLSQEDVWKVIVVDAAIEDADLRPLSFLPSRDASLRMPGETFLLEDKFSALGTCGLSNTLADSWAQDGALVLSLRRLGLRLHLSTAEVVQVATKIAEDQCADMAHLLAQFLRSGAYADAEKTDELRVALRKIAWLPTAPRPTHWVGQWKSEAFLALERTVVCAYEDRDLAGYVASILSAELQPATLSWLGVTSPDMSTIVRNLHDAATSWASLPEQEKKLLIQPQRSVLARPNLRSVSARQQKETSWDQWSLLLQSMYKALNSEEVSRGIEQGTLTRAWIWVGDDFVEEREVSKEKESATWAPYIYVLRQEWHGYPVFSNVQGELIAQTLVEMLHRIAIDQTHAQNAQISILNDKKRQIAKKRQIEASAAIVLLLYKRLHEPHATLTREPCASVTGVESFLEKYPSVLPNSVGELKPAREVLINDMAHLENQPMETDLVLNTISFAVALCLGATRLSRRRCEQLCPSKDAWLLKPTGQAEPLVRRLHNIVGDYPLESVVKEMLQNAEDAKATVFHVILDWRKHATKSLLTSEMEKWQGPSLYFYNDALFSEHDWTSIVRLGEGGKRNEPNTIGRHGLGFNSVFNLTDVPSIWSGSKILFLDPHLRHLENVGANLQKPGVSLDFADAADENACWPDQFDPYQKIGIAFTGRHLPGTVVRVPLRTFKHNSEISDCVLTPKKWRDWVKDLKAESHHYLLFLENVADFRVYHIPANAVRSNFTSKKPSLVLARSKMHGDHAVQIHATGDTDVQWSYDMASFGSVHVASRSSQEQEEGQFFCRLPLLVSTDCFCTVHVSALFATSHDRRALLMEESGGIEMADACRTNQKLLAEVAQAMGNLIEQYTRSRERMPLHLFPRAGNARHTQVLTDYFYTDVVLQHPAMHCTMYGDILEQVDRALLVIIDEGVPPSKNFASEESMGAIWQRLRCPVVRLSHAIMDEYTARFAAKFDILDILTPDSLLRWFAQSQILAQWQDVEKLLEYAVRDVESARKVQGCGLRALCDGQVTMFSSDASQTICAVSDVEWELALHLPKCMARVQSRQVCAYLIEAEVVQSLNLENLAQLMTHDGSGPLVNAFWAWLPTQFSNRRPPAPHQPHVLDAFGLLPSKQGIFPFSDRKRCVMAIPSATFSGIENVLAACGVVLATMAGMQHFVHPGVADGVVSALYYALEQSAATDWGRIPPNEWKNLLHYIMPTVRYEQMRHICQRLPLFQVWGGELHPLSAELRLFPIRCEEDVKDLLRQVDALRLPLLDEVTGSEDTFTVYSHLREVHGLQPLSMSAFLAQYIFPNLASFSPDHVRDALTMCCLKVDLTEEGSTNPEVSMQYLAGPFRFLPTKSGDLMSASDTLDPRLANRFPGVDFPKCLSSAWFTENPGCVHELQQMRWALRRKLTSEEILSVAEHGAQAQDKKLGRELLTYLGELGLEIALRTATTQCTSFIADETFAKLNSIRWMPAAYCPHDAKDMPWGAREGLLQADTDTIFGWKHHQLAGWKYPVVFIKAPRDFLSAEMDDEAFVAGDTDLNKRNIARSTVCNALGSKFGFQREVSQDILEENLHALIQFAKGKIASKPPAVPVEKKVSVVFLSELDTASENEEESVAEVEFQYICHIYCHMTQPPQSLKDWVWSASLGKFVAIDDVSKDCDTRSLEPILSMLPKRWHAWKVFAAVPEKLNASTLFYALGKLGAEQTTSFVKVDGTWMRSRCFVCYMVVKLLYYLRVPLHTDTRILVPTVQDTIVPAAAAYYPDLDFSGRTPGRVATHRFVDAEVASAVGVKRQSELYLEELQLNVAWGDAMHVGKLQALVAEEVKTFKDVFCAWLQFADSKGATKVQIFADWYRFDGSRLLSPQFSECLEPSLWLVHDAPMTDEEWPAIARLPWLYYFSNFPVVATGGSVAFLDPTWSKSDPGLVLKMANSETTVADLFPDQFAPFADKWPLHRFFQGTAIRLPLRSATSCGGVALCPMMLEKMQWSDEVVPWLHRELPAASVFLRSIRRIEVGERTEQKPLGRRRLHLNFVDSFSVISEETTLAAGSESTIAKKRVKISDEPLEAHWLIAFRDATTTALSLGATPRGMVRNLFPAYEQSSFGQGLALQFAEPSPNETTWNVVGDLLVYAILYIPFWAGAEKLRSDMFEPLCATTSGLSDDKVHRNFHVEWCPLTDPNTPCPLTTQVAWGAVISRLAAGIRIHHKPLSAYWDYPATPTVPQEDWFLPAKTWLRDNVDILEYPAWYKRLARIAGSTNMVKPLPGWSIVQGEFRRGSCAAAEVLRWAIQQFPTESFVAEWVPTESGQLTSERPCWYCSVRNRALLQFPQVSRRVVVCPVLEDRQLELGLKDPRNLADVAKHPEDINCKEFWRYVAANIRDPHIQDHLPLVIRKLTCGVRRLGQSEMVPFEPYCALAGKERFPSTVFDALVTIGCRVIVDSIPRYARPKMGMLFHFAGESISFVLRHIQLVGQIVWKPGPHIATLTQWLLDPEKVRTLDHADASVLLTLRLIPHNEDLITLEDCDFVDSEPFAKMFQPEAPVFCASDPKYVHFVVVAKQLRTSHPVAVVEKHASCLQRKPAAIVDQILVQAAQGAANHEADLLRLSKCRVYEGDKSLGDFWDENHGLVQLITGAADVDLGTFPRKNFVQTCPPLSAYLKTPHLASALVALLRLELHRGINDPTFVWPSTRWETAFPR